MGLYGQSARQALYDGKGRVPLSGFELVQIAALHVGIERERLLGQPLGLAVLTHVSTD